MGIIGQSPPQTLPLLGLIRAPTFLPTWLNSFLFESHWPLWVALAVAAVVLAFLSLRGQPKCRLPATILAALLLLWVLLAYAVVTPGERLVAAHQRLLDATIHKNLDAFTAELAPDFQFGTYPKDTLTTDLRGYFPTMLLSAHTITFYEATPADAGNTEVKLGIITSLGAPGEAKQPILTNWGVTNFPGDDQFR